MRLLIVISFALGFSGTTLLPSDLSLNPQNGDKSEMLAPWHIVFWSTFLLAWVILPFIRECIASGEFTFLARLKDASRRLIKVQLILLVVAMICVIALAIHLKSVNVIPVLIALGNTYGLIIVALLLGDGLVALPRSLWRKADPEVELRRTQIIAGAADEALFEAVWKLQDCEFEIDQAISKIDDLDDTYEPDIYYKFCVDQLLQFKHSTANLSPLLNMRRTNQTGRSQRDSLAKNNSEPIVEMPTLQQLRRLNAHMKCAQDELFSAEQQWNDIVDRSRFLTDITSGPSSPSSPNLNGNTPLLLLADSGLRNCSWRIQYYSMKYLRPLAYRCVAAITACLSICVLWSEVTLPLRWDLSPFSLMLNSFEQGILFEISALVPLVYMSVCVYSSLFKLSIFGPYSLHGRRRSNGASLTFNAQYLVRLQFPLGYNFLLMLKYHDKSAFSNFMGVMDVVPMFGKSFSVYAPLMILAVCLFTMFNVHARILSLLGFEHQDAILAGDQETLKSKVDEGMMLLRRHQEREKEIGMVPMGADKESDCHLTSETDESNGLTCSAEVSSQEWKKSIV